MLFGLFVPTHSIHLQNEVDFGGLLILRIFILGLHIDLIQLENEAIPYFTLVATRSSFALVK